MTKSKRNDSVEMFLYRVELKRRAALDRTTGVKPRNARPTEHAIQSAFFDWVRSKRDEIPALWFFYSIPNEAGNVKRVGKLKQRGLSAGIPDVHLEFPAGKFRSLYIEFKRPRAQMHSKQIEWAKRLSDAQHCVVVCTSAAQAIDLTMLYLSESLFRD